jgi:exodeoxyribonuclease V beta subunit
MRGHFALLRWLRQNISASSQADDQSRLSLESDEQLIRIVTIHKSKGLEYPYVFLPFISSARGADLAWFSDDSGKLNLDLLKLKSNSSLVERERLAEDIRLLYVALTRAKYQCFLSTFFYKGRGTSLGLAKTAWAYLIARDDVLNGLDEEAYRDALERLAQESSSMIEFELIDENSLHSALRSSTQSVQKYNVQVEESGFYSSSLLEHSLLDSWRVQSFTGLMQEIHASHRAGIPSTIPSTRRNENLSGERESSTLSIFDFPRGSRAGTFLHTLFENIVFDTAQPLKALNAQSETLSLKSMISEKLALSRLVSEEQQVPWAEYLSDWLLNILQVPLDEGFSLANLPQGDYQVEMEFFFRVEQCNFNQFNALLQQYMDVPKLEFSSFEGHLKGAIDLVFVREGKYYLLDYKSNYLGEELPDYSQQNLSAAMLDHRYDLQYLIYSVALHRYLKARLGKHYSYSQNFGGVYYLYLRGMPIACDMQHDNTETSGVYFVKPDADLISALDQHLGGV